MNTTIRINPVQFWPTTASYITINDVYVTLGVSANCQYVFSDTDQQVISSSAQRWTMTTGQYANWQGDDQYFVDTCLQSLGLIPA